MAKQHTNQKEFKYFNKTKLEQNWSEQVLAIRNKARSMFAECEVELDRPSHTNWIRTAQRDTNRQQAFDESISKVKNPEDLFDLWYDYLWHDEFLGLKTEYRLDSIFTRIWLDKAVELFYNMLWNMLYRYSTVEPKKVETFCDNKAKEFAKHWE